MNTPQKNKSQRPTNVHSVREEITVSIQAGGSRLLSSGLWMNKPKTKQHLSSRLHGLLAFVNSVFLPKATANQSDPFYRWALPPIQHAQSAEKPTRANGEEHTAKTTPTYLQ